MTGKMSGTRNTVQKRSYTEAVAANLPARTPPSNPRLEELICSLRKLLALKPMGISLNEARRSCPLLLDSELLQDHPSIRHLLLSMSSVVCLKGFGAQTRLFPAP